MLSEFVVTRTHPNASGTINTFIIINNRIAISFFVIMHGYTRYRTYFGTERPQNKWYKFNTLSELIFESFSMLFRIRAGVLCSSIS